MGSYRVTFVDPTNPLVPFGESVETDIPPEKNDRYLIEGGEYFARSIKVIGKTAPFLVYVRIEKSAEKPATTLTPEERQSKIDAILKEAKRRADAANSKSER